MRTLMPVAINIIGWWGRYAFIECANERQNAVFGLIHPLI